MEEFSTVRKNEISCKFPLSGTIQSERGNPNLERQMSHDLSNMEMLALKLVFSMYLIWNSHGGHEPGKGSTRVENSSEMESWLFEGGMGE